MKLRRMVRKLLFILILFLVTSELHAQASWEKFGQNRVQYYTFNWSFYDTTHFRVFYNGSGKAHAVYCANIAEQQLQPILNLMGGRLYNKLNIIIYNSFNDYKQTNIGRKNEEFNEANGGKVSALGENIPVYFSGDHPDMKKQIMKGIASILKDELIYGSTLKEVLKSSIQLNLPDWYTNGYVNYICNDWTAAMQEEVRNLAQVTKRHRFEDVATEKPDLIGHSFWHFVEKKYGSGTISNMIYVTRARRNINKPFELVLHKNMKKVFLEWKEFYTEPATSIAWTDSINYRKEIGRIAEKKGVQYSQFALSPTGREIAYVEKVNGQFNIYMLDLKYNKTYKILEGGLRSWSEMSDPDYPILTWSGSGKKMAILYHRNQYLFLRTYISGQRKMTNKLIKRNRVERITSMCFTPDENNIAIAGIKKGQSDLMYLNLKNTRVEHVTKDLYDDKDPVLIGQGEFNGILFLSNRNSSYLGGIAKKDDYNDFYNLFLYRSSKGNNLLQLTRTNTTLYNPIPWGDESFAFLQEENGKVVRKIAHVIKAANGDTVEMQSSAPLPFVPVKQDFIQTTKTIVELAREGKDFVIYASPFDSVHKQNTRYQESLKQDTLTPPVESALVKDTLPEYYHSFLKDEPSSVLKEIFLEKRLNSDRYLVYTANTVELKPKKYTPNFYVDNVQPSLDNTLLFTRYQPYEGAQSVFNNPPLSGFLSASISDIMEDYKIVGGARLGSDFNSIDYFTQFHNFRKRLDWGLLFFHNSTRRVVDISDKVPSFTAPVNVAKYTLDYMQGHASYPLDALRSFRFQLGLRRDAVRYSTTNQYTLKLEDEKTFWSFFRAEYVFDNTTRPLLNIWKGSRAKCFIEYQYRLNNGSIGFYNFGYDGRNYLQLYKNVILASRIAGSHSGGTAKILYMVGGVDNDVNPKNDLNTIVDTSQNYAFQSLATNLRGYRQGFRKGNSFLVVNEEVRIPIMNTVTNRYVRSGFLRYMQWVIFADLGSSWNGIVPNSDNIKLPRLITGNPVSLYINNNGYDFGLGYGTGLRTKLLGYFLRADVAWNVEGQRKPILHISMATDF
jgi:hypothetical protein